MLPMLARWGARVPSLANAVLASGLLRRSLGLDPQRPLPRLAGTTLAHWWRRRSPPHTGRRGEVVLISDPFTCYFEPEVGIAAVEFMEWAGYQVRLTPCLSSGRVQISQGLLQAARKTLTCALERLYPAVAAGIPVIGLEPSELLTFRDEAPDLVRGKDLRRRAQRVAEGAWLFEEWVCQAQREAHFVVPDRSEDPPHILVHTHCHQKALSDPKTALDCLKIIPRAEIAPVAAGCCGMAGVFGYEREHAELSRVIGELTLLPAVRAAPPGALFAASGISCRQQLWLGAGVSAQHPAELLRAALP